MKEFCGAIQYERDGVGGIHSDICFHSNRELTEDYRKFLHDCLDEWLDNAKGTGCFWVGDPVEMANEFSQDLVVYD